MTANPVGSLAEEEERRIEETYLRPIGGGERIADLRDALHQTLESGVGVYRTGESLQQTCDEVERLRERFKNVRLDDHSHVFNTELFAALELGFMIDRAESIVYAALARIRGAHSRRDFPSRDDENFLAHSMAYRTDGTPRIEYKPVRITR